MWPNPHFPADLVTLTEEILNGKLHFWCSACTNNQTDYSNSMSTRMDGQTQLFSHGRFMKGNTLTK